MPCRLSAERSEAALPHLQRIADEHDGDTIGQIAARQRRKAAAAIKSR
jgi:hypothetical protein